MLYRGRQPFNRQLDRASLSHGRSNVSKEKAPLTVTEAFASPLVVCDMAVGTKPCCKSPGATAPP
jgi:hypothetical protein